MSDRRRIAKIREYIEQEDLSKEEFVKRHLYYDNWEGSCSNCDETITEDDECLVILNKDIEGKRNAQGETMYCKDCYPTLSKLLFG